MRKEDMENSLRKIFKAPYDRDTWRQTLAGILGTENVKYHLTPYTHNLTESQQKIAQKVFNLGFISTAEGYQLPVFEVSLAPNIVIERNRVTVNNLVKNIILKDAREGAIAVFYYPDNSKTEWRFSFISPGSEDSYFEELETPATNPKRFTYVFGIPEEEHRTAAQRFSVLARSQKTLNDFFTAFDVDKLSKQFFDEYKKHYEQFVEYLNHSPFKKVVFNGDEKAIRDFVKKLLGRIIFLYFVQKKGWLGASSIDYKDGDKNFLQNLFIQSGKNENFYPIWLSKLFFETLNNPARADDDFEMPDGSHVKIPYLNGGLFEKEKFDESLITFPADLFDDLFTFLNRYNFTIYENSPEDHTIAVDPEMLGHIFENLLEDNKDKGAYYTPKEIVHYMTQESLIEYLHTHLPEVERKKIEILVKNKVKLFSDDVLDKIDHLLDNVKICDPAIGSGAFPMGLLQEIYALKELIAYEKGFVIASPARVKERIIQNSIYGVDIEQGAVDIARLRFWLSLVVDEDKPRALPNLDYKIVVGNSLVSKVEIDGEEEIVEIDWDLKYSVGKADEYIQNVQKLLNKIVEKQKQYFHPNAKNKEKLKNEIESLKIELLINQLKYEKEKFINTSDLGNGHLFYARLTKVQRENHIRLERYNRIIDKLEELKKRPEKSFKHFDWKLDFPEVLNPAIAGENPGFDIIIANPPYIKEYTNRKAFDGIRNSPYYQGKMDIWYFFASISIDLLKNNGVECFIAQNNWITSAGASKFRNKVLKETEILLFTDFGDYKVFQSAGIQTMIYLLKKTSPQKSYLLKYSRLILNQITKNQLIAFLNFENKNDKISKKFIIEIHPNEFIDNYITFINPEINLILNQIKSRASFYLNENEIIQGIVSPQDFLNKNGLKKLNRPDYYLGEGIFILKTEELQSLNLSKHEYNLIKPYYTTEELGRYYGNPKNKLWIIYTNSDIKDHIHKYPKIKAHLDRFKKVITSDFGPYGLHRSRDERFFKGEKIISLRKCKIPTFTYTDFDCYVSQTFFVIKTERVNLKYLTALLNSRIVAFWLKYKGKLQGDLYQIDKIPLMEIPLIKINSTKPFKILVDYIIFLKGLDYSLNDYVPNEHVAQQFEEIIDAMVFELYFPGEFKKAGIAFIPYAEKDFKPIEGISEEEKKKIVHRAYQLFRQPDNPIRNNLKLMDIRLKDLIMPIKTVY